MKNVVNMHLHVKSSKLEPSIHYPCSYGSFETCLQNKRKELNNSCQVPFELDVHDDTICKTDEDGYKAMKELSTLTSKCTPSCQVVDIKIMEIPQNLGALSVNDFFKVGLLEVSRMTPGYYIDIPSTAGLTSISYDYGFISYVAEFAGWSGMFVGASLLWIVGITTSLLSWFTSIKIEEKFIANIVKILSLFYLLYLVYTCTVKFLGKPQGVMVDFKNTKIEFDMTICSSKFVVGYLAESSVKYRGKILGIFKITYIITILQVDIPYLINLGVSVSHLNTSKFWNNLKNISLVVDSLELDYGFGNVNFMRDEIFKAKDIKIYAVPSSNYTIDGCFNINLPKEIELKSISVTYLAEVNVYLHSPGQFFYVWNNEKNIISSSSNLIIKYDGNQIIWHDLSVNFVMERNIGLPDNNQQSYDDCVLNLPVEKSALIKDYIEPSSVGSSGNRSSFFGKLPINHSRMRQIYDVLSYSDDYCVDPSETIKNEMIPARRRAKRTIKRPVAINDYVVFTEDLGLHKEKNKPKIIINIPSFTKIVQVSPFKFSALTKFKKTISLMILFYISQLLINQILMILML